MNDDLIEKRLAKGKNSENTCATQWGGWQDFYNV